MARIDDNGLLFSEPGDVLKVEHSLRPHDYGALETDDCLPLLLAFHLTGNLIPFGSNDADHDGTRGMAGRIAAGTAKYYAHLYLGRDAHAFQVVPFTRCAIHIAGKYEGKEINKIASGIEVANLGYARPNGQAPGFAVDPTREDLVQNGPHLWQMLTEQQNSAILELTEAWRRWTRRPVADCIRGHHDLDPDSSHVDPGPLLRAFLDGPVKTHLEGILL
jgi:hypothetical protein